MVTANTIGTVRNVVGLLPKTGLLDLPLAGIQGMAEGEEEFTRLQSDWANLAEDARRSPILQQKITSLRYRCSGRLREAAASSVGMFAGATAATALLGPVGWVGGLVVGGLGGMGGGMVADKAYNYFKPPAPQDAISIAIKIDTLRKKGHRIPKEVMGVLAIAMMTGAAGKRAEDALEKAFGTRDFDAALTQAMETGQVNRLRPIISKFENDIALQMRLPLDRDNPDKAVGAQMADLVNVGAVTAKDFIGNPGKVSRVALEYTQGQTTRAVSENAAGPAVRAMNLPQLSRGVANLGVA